MNPLWLDKTEYPFTSKFMKVNEHHLHYIDEGKGETLLFVHGTPSWSFDFRNLIKKLSTSYRCVAIDHIGFGLSDKPEFYDYSTLNHSNTLEKFIIEKQLQNITLVVHDFGGPIGLNITLNHSSKFKNLVILNSWLWSSSKDSDFIKFSKILRNPILPFLYLNFNFSPRFILPSSFGDKKISKAILKQYTSPFSIKKERKGALAFVHSLLNDQDWFETLWQKRHLIAHKPTLFIWGMKDPVIKPKNLEKFQSAFTNSKTVRLETCGHFPQEEESEKVYQAIIEFLSINN